MLTPIVSFFFSSGVALAVAMVAAQRRPPNYNPASMPETDFDCSDKIIGGYYGDAETECQMFHVCVKVPGIGVQDFRFLCPNDTAFDQENQVCDDWYNIDCESSSLYLGDNFDLFRIGAGQTSNPRAPGSRPSPTPIPLGPSTQRPGLNGQPQPAAPQGLPPAPRTKPIASNHAGEEDDDFFLQRADTGDRRLHHGTSRDLFKGSQSGNFFNSKNGGKDDDDDYEPDTRPNAFRHSQKAKPTGPLPQFVQQYQQQKAQQPQQPQQQPAQPQRSFQQQQQQPQQQRSNIPQPQQPQQTTPQRSFQQPQQTTPQRSFQQQQQTTQPARQNYPLPQTTPRPNNFPQQQQQANNFPQQENGNQQRKKKVTVRRKLVQKGSQDQDQQQYHQQQQQYQQQQQQYQQQPRHFDEQSDEEYYRTYQHDQYSNIDSPNQAFGQRGNFPAIRTTIAPITHPSTVATQETRGFNTQTQGFASGAPTTAFTAATITVVDAARNHNYQTKARYNTIQRSRGELPTTATEYFTSPSTPAPTTTQQKQYSLFYAKQQQQQQQQQQQTIPPTTQQQRGSSPAAAATATTAAANNNNNRFNYNTYKLNNNNGGSTTQSDDYERPEDQEFLKTAHSSNYRASDFNSFNRASFNAKDSGSSSSAYNTKAAGNQTTASVQTTKPSSAFPVYFPTSPRPAPFSPPQSTPPPPARQATASTQQAARDNYYSPQNAPRPFSPSPAPAAPAAGSPATSAPSTVAAFNNQFNSRQQPAASRQTSAPATTAAPAPPPPPKKYTAKVLPNSGSASPTAAAPLKSTASAIKNDYDYAYYDDSDAGAYEYGLDPISDSHFAKTRTDSVKIKKDQQ
ncbi:hypothetical protein KUF71_008300 [Frankliniella fusca]|uniref:Chitin-binding type-2 domain-containing protein n=1 Tax=Frankliniella fusca TaxID=407009 RepID=A0AAE1HD23_9NEOP|nr:hypothetical protein KUF71_008300 [Frankliniella fusca]